MTTHSLEWTWPTGKRSWSIPISHEQATELHADVLARQQRGEYEGVSVKVVPAAAIPQEYEHARWHR